MSHRYRSVSELSPKERAERIEYLEEQRYRRSQYPALTDKQKASIYAQVERAARSRDLSSLSHDAWSRIVDRALPSVTDSATLFAAEKYARSLKITPRRTNAPLKRYLKDTVRRMHRQGVSRRRAAEMLYAAGLSPEGDDE